MRLRSVFIGPIFFFFGREIPLSAYTEAVIRWQSRQLRGPKDLDQLLQGFNPLFAVNAILALSLTLMVYICLQALKMTLISAWIPAVLTGKASVTKGFGLSLRSTAPFWKHFVNYLTANYLIVVVNVVFGLATLGSALLITVPLSYLFLLALQCVHFYEDNGMKYFISVHNIAGAEGAPAQDIDTGEDSLEELNKKINAPDGEE